MLLYWLWLTTRRGLAKHRYPAVLECFGSPEEAYYAEHEVYRLAGFSAQEIQTLCDKSLELPRQILAACTRKNIHILTYQDASYPDRLRSIPDPPAVLYYLGNLPDFDREAAIAIIGSRKSTPYGLNHAKRFGFQVAICGGLVVSGMAAGGDSAAMEGALTAGRPTVGVLGCGVDIVYPKQSQHLYEDVCRWGCVLSEYPPGTPPYKQNFPERNRIISGLTRGVLVIEAGARSGTQITVNQALDQGRDVYVLPTNIGLEASAGNIRLLKEGAAAVESGWDVLSNYQEDYPDRVKWNRLGEAASLAPHELHPLHEQPQMLVAEELVSYRTDDRKVVDNSENKAYIDVQAILAQQPEDEQAILRQLFNGEMHPDELVARTGLSVSRVLMAMTQLELKGYVVRQAGNRYALAMRG